MFFFGGVLIVLYLVRLWLTSFGGIHPDETYYWVWSQHLKLGYFDHPPMLAWIIRLGGVLADFFIPESLQRSSPLFFAQISFRWLPYLLTTIFLPLTMAAIVQLVQRKPIRVMQMLVIISSPIFILGPEVITPDTPFFLAWTLCLYYAVKFQRLRSPDSIAGDTTPLHISNAVKAGLVLAFAAYSKYSAILAAFVFAVTGAGLMNCVVAGLVSLTLAFPHLVWNYTVGLPENAGVFFQLKHGLGDSAVILNKLSYKRVGDLILSQFFLWSPLIFIFTFYSLLSNVRNFFAPQKRSRLVGTLFIWAAVPLFFFCLSTLKRPAEANWPLVGAIAALILVLSRYLSRTGWLSIFFLSNMFTVILAIMIVTEGPFLSEILRPIFPELSKKLDQPSRLKEFENWDKLHKIVFEGTESPSHPVKVQSYQILSELLFFDHIAGPQSRFGDRLKIWVEGSRRSEFNLTERYILKDESQPHWLLSRGSNASPTGCTLHQTVFKGPSDPAPYLIYRCHF